MLMFQKQIQSIANEIHTEVSKNGCMVWLGNGENRGNLDKISDRLPETFLIVPAFLTKADGTRRKSDKLNLVVVANNPAALWSGWTAWLNEYHEKAGKDDPEMITYLGDFTKLIRDTLDNMYPGIQLP